MSVLSGNHELAIAAGNVDLTPTQSVPLASYRALRTEKFESIADSLEANVAVFHAAGVPTVFVSADLLYIGAYISERIFAAFADRVPRERIFLAASHTHFAPATEDSLPGLGRADPEYREWAAERIIALTASLLAQPSVAIDAGYHEASFAYSVNRRQRKWGIGRNFPHFGFQTIIAPNESGLRDDVIRVLVPRDAHGKVNAICWSYACHPNTYPRINAVSAEYPGYVRQALRQRFGNIPVLFWQGFSGNINPYRYPQAAHLAQASRERFIAPDLSHWEQWCKILASAVEAAVDAADRRIGGPISCQLRSIDLKELGLRSDKRLVCRTIRFGDALAVCGLSAEVVVEYVARVRAAHLPVPVVPVGCMEDVFGYLPDGGMMSGGGYEVTGFLRRFGLGGKFKRSVGDIVAHRLLRSAASGASNA